MNTDYDFVIVGAGSAGCALANRLTENGRHRVLLLEAGRKGHPLSRIPVSFSRLIDNPVANWRFRSEPEDATNNRVIPVPRGKLLGGSSSINGMVYVRGQRQDYDTWAQLGNRGWSFDDVLPVFKRMEHYEEGADEYRGEGGPLRVSVAPDENPIYDALFRAGDELGFPRNPDYNGATTEGIVKTQTTISNGRRMSAAYAYLDPIRKRKNLTIETGALARKVLLQDKTCTGVEYAMNGRTVEATARREVILCGGAINSPQLLELSGIGQEQVLQALGIDVEHALSGVGENLRDHIAPRMIFNLDTPGLAFNDRARGIGLLGQILRYALTRGGLLNLPSAPVIAFLKTHSDLQTPDIQLHFVPYQVVQSNNKRKLGKDPGITCTVYQCRPESLGSIHIRSTDPAQQPAIRFNFLSTETDRQTLIAGIRVIRRIIATDAMQTICGAEVQPGADAQSDDEILAFIRDKAETAFHPIGTCKMGSDPLAVVDHELRVHGIDRLRVADGSIMPTLISGNTNGPCMMIGETCADLVLAAV
ncbi:MAG: choline dehydrogenase [Gammaproteobacteria bacterium]|nr:choline dehydrogenase [Gammaproteobacteria bacterium]